MFSISVVYIYWETEHTFFSFNKKRQNTKRKIKVRAWNLYQGASNFSYQKTQDASRLKPSRQILTLPKVVWSGKFILPKESLYSSPNLSHSFLCVTLRSFSVLLSFPLLSLSVLFSFLFLSTPSYFFLLLSFSCFFNQKKKIALGP